MRASLLLPVLLLAACASTPSANDHVEAPVAELEAKQRELANAEARVKQLRTVLDLDESADADDLRAYNAAYDNLLRLRGEYPDVESGYDDLGWHPLQALGSGAYQTGGTIPTEPGGINPGG